MKKFHSSKLYVGAALLGALSLSISSSNAYDRSALPASNPFVPNQQQASNLGSKYGNTAMHAEGGVQFVNPQSIPNSPKVKLRELSLKAQKILSIIENNPALSTEAAYLKQAMQSAAQVLYRDGNNTTDSISLLENTLNQVNNRARELGINLNENQYGAMDAQQSTSSYSQPKIPTGGFSYWGGSTPSNIPGAAPHRPLPAIPTSPMAVPPARPQGNPDYNSFSNLGNDQTQYPDVFQSHLGERSSPNVTPPARPQGMPGYNSFSHLGNDQTQYPDVFQSHLGERPSPSVTPPARPGAPVPSYPH